MNTEIADISNIPFPTDFPIECLGCIFNTLPSNNFLNVILVCKRWQFAIENYCQTYKQSLFAQNRPQQFRHEPLKPIRWSHITHLPLNVLSSVFLNFTPCQVTAMEAVCKRFQSAAYFHYGRLVGSVQFSLDQSDLKHLAITRSVIPLPEALNSWVKAKENHQFFYDDNGRPWSIAIKPMIDPNTPQYSAVIFTLKSEHLKEETTFYSTEIESIQTLLSEGKEVNKTVIASYDALEANGAIQLITTLAKAREAGRAFSFPQWDRKESEEMSVSKCSHRFKNLFNLSFFKK